MTASSTTLTPPMLADWTASGARTSGLTAPQMGATRTATGGAATTSTPRAQPQRDVPGAGQQAVENSQSNFADSCKPPLQLPFVASARLSTRAIRSLKVRG